MSIAEMMAAGRALCRPAAKLPAHVVLLTNFIPPYRLPVYSELAGRVEKLTILLSTPMEPNRSWQAEWGALDVRLQRTCTVRRRWRHAAGFTDTLHIHVPVDTLGQLKRLRPDVIISAELGTRSLLSTMYARRRPTTPVVLWLTLSDHTEQGRGRLRHALRRWLLARADAVVVNGASGARYVERFGFDPRSIFRVPYTAVPNLFEHLPARRSNENAHRLLCVGQLIERKGLGPFIAALAHWASSHPERDVTFDLVGSGPLREKLGSMCVPPNLSLRFLGERNYDALAQVYTEAGIFAFPTLADEWGLVTNEAMSAGLPVLGSVYSQAVEELCRDGDNGWTFRPDSQEDTVDAIDRALSTPSERLDAMRAQARADVAYLTPRHAVDRLLEAVEHATNVAGGSLR
ncbi:MAG TPA: glycosyltransferase family 4 protein [Pirellulales bacterium]|nr:glycosyltransferase family 4 protein [Pirellulales bacterium]